MNFSCASTLLTACGARDFREATAMAAAIGCNGLHVDCDPGGLLPAQSFSFRASGELVQHAHEHKIEIHCLTANPWIPSDPDDAAFGLKRLVCMAHALACPLVAVAPPALDAAAALDPQCAHAIAAFKDAVGLGEELDICIAIEPMAGTLAANADEAIDLVDDVDLTNLGIVYNPARLAAQGGEPPEVAIDMLKGDLLLVTIEPAGQDAVTRGDFDDALHRLHAAGYKEYVTDCTHPACGMTADQLQHMLRRNMAHLRGITASSQ